MRKNQYRIPLFLTVLIAISIVITASVSADVPRQNGDPPTVYVVAAVDTEADNNHPMGNYHTVFEVYNYQRPADECPAYETKYSQHGSTWSAYTDGTVFNFEVKPAGEEESVEGFTCGNDAGYGLDDYHRALQFTVPEDGSYDIAVQINYVGSPPNTPIHVVPDDNGDPDTASPLATYTLSTSGFSSGDYVTIAEDLTLTSGQPYWWYADRQSSGNNDNQFAVYRGIAGGSTTISRIMEENFRNSHVDSFGDPFKMTWFMEMDNYINQGQYQDGTPFDYLTLYNEMLDNWGSEVESWGDEMAYHHHFAHWDGSSWVHTTDLTGYDWHNEALDYMILDANYFPVTFRSGWLWTNDDLQAWIEDWMPIDYSNLPGNQYWPNSPTSWSPYQPSSSDYQTTGDMNHWIARCDSDPSQGGINSAFAEAQDSEGPVIYCWYTHKRSNMRSDLESAQTYLDNAASNPDYEGVSFRYATAQESLKQAVLDCTDDSPPVLTLLELDGMYKTIADEPLWGNHPYVTARYSNLEGEVYTHTVATQYATNAWEVAWPGEITVSTPPAPYEVDVTAENEDPERPASHAVDGNPETYWDSTDQEVPVWIQTDLGETREVRRFTIHFYDRDDREYRYEVEASTDGSTWTGIVPEETIHGQTSHVFDPAVSMRYARVRVIGNDAPTNNYAHIREIALYEHTEPQAETFYLQEVGAGAVDLCGNGAAASQPVGAELTVAKTASPDVMRIGEPLTYTVTITNESAWELTDLVLTDDLPDSMTFESATTSQGAGCIESRPLTCNLGDLAADATAQVTINVIPTTNGSINNEAEVTALDPLNNTVRAVANVSVDVIAPDIEITKTADPTVVNVGDTVNYTITVENTGDSDLSDVNVTDPLPGCTLTGPSGDDGDNILQPDESWTYTCSITAGEENTNEDIENTASVTAIDEAGGTVSAESETITVDVIAPDIEITKTADPTVVNVGDTVNYTIVVENTGDSDLFNVNVTDPLPGCTLTGPSGDDGDDILQPDESWTYTCSITAGEENTNEDIENTASVTAIDEAGGTVSAESETVFVDVINPLVRFSKDVAPTTVRVGDTVYYTITVENTGNSSLSDVTVEDSLPGCTLTGPSGDDGDEILQVSETWVYTCHVTAGEENLVNTATFTATDTLGTNVTDATRAEAVEVLHPEIKIIKTLTTDPVSIGSSVTFAITVTNTGDVRLTRISVTDPRVKICEIELDALDAGESESYTCQDSTVEATYTNIATVEGLDPLDRSVSDSDEAEVEVEISPAPPDDEYKIYLPIAIKEQAAAHSSGL